MDSVRIFAHRRLANLVLQTSPNTMHNWLPTPKCAPWRSYSNHPSGLRAISCSLDLFLPHPTASAECRISKSPK